jgi:hypothetical protein
MKSGGKLALMSVAFCINHSVLGATLDSLADCSGVLIFAAIPAKKATTEAPIYARDKYLKQVQFYQQGANNLKKRASQMQGYNQKDFDVKQEAMGMKLFNQVKANSISLDSLNMSISECISEAGLYMSDYPR